ncbi:MAG: CaiB/BaiF CoA transferase family protein [Burkholderiaceae bacterium]
MTRGTDAATPTDAGRGPDAGQGPGASQGSDAGQRPGAGQGSDVGQDPDAGRGPLAGIRVLDMTSVVMGPYATQWLGDFGADVIKIEPPDGDVMRLSGPMRSPRMGHFYLSTNRNKRSLAIDLKRPAGRDILLAMARHADVLVYNVRPQAMKRLGLGYETLQAVNPRLIFVGGFGFSQRGRYADRPAYDDLIQGMSAMPALSAQAGGEPRYAPVVLADRIVGIQLALAVTTALFHRERSGRGQKIDVPMFEGLASMVLGEHLAGRQFHPPIGPTGYSRSLTPGRRPYRTRDGYLCTLIYNDRQWRAFLQVIGKPELMHDDPRFASQGARLQHIDEVYAYLSDVLRTRDTDEWLRLFAQADLPAAPLYSLDDLIDDAHLRDVGLLQTTEHPTEGEITSIANPTEWSDSPPALHRHAPTLGEHTLEVLREHGFPEEQLRAWLADGVVFAAQRTDPG